MTYFLSSLLGTLLASCVLMLFVFRCLIEASQAARADLYRPMVRNMADARDLSETEAAHRQ